jgi:hypothetical protein
MDGWMERWTDGWMDEGIDGWMDGWMDGLWRHVLHPLPRTLYRAVYPLLALPSCLCWLPFLPRGLGSWQWGREDGISASKFLVVCFGVRKYEAQVLTILFFVLLLI